MNSPDLIFLIEKLMGLFWVFIQQICFCGVGYVYGNLVHPDRGSQKFFGRQAIAFLVLCLLCFERELGIPFLSSLLLLEEGDFYPWAILIILCSAMILFDALLLLYTWRVYRVYRRGTRSIGRTFPVDLCFIVAVGTVCCMYIRRSIDVTLLYGLSGEEYIRIGRAFIQLSNFFYVPLEITGALLLYFFRRAVRRNIAPGETEEREYAR